MAPAGGNLQKGVANVTKEEFEKTLESLSTEALRELKAYLLRLRDNERIEEARIVSPGTSPKK